MHAKIDKKSQKNGISCEMKLLKEKHTLQKSSYFMFYSILSI